MIRRRLAFLLFAVLVLTAINYYRSYSLIARNITTSFHSKTTNADSYRPSEISISDDDTYTDDGSSDDSDVTDDGNTTLIWDFNENLHHDTFVPAKKGLGSRAKQNPQGQLWEGWPDDGFNHYDYFNDKSLWWRNSKTCFEVHHICHANSETNDYISNWFYYTPQQQQQTKHKEHMNSSKLFQPSLELRSEPAKYDRGLVAEDRIGFQLDAHRSTLKEEDVEFGTEKDGTNYFTIKRNNHGDDDLDYNDDETESTKVSNHSFMNHPHLLPSALSCHISKVHTHMVLQSLFNFMIGEFYARTLLPIYRLMTTTNRINIDKVEDIGGDEKLLLKNRRDNHHSYYSNIQYYVHFAHGNHEMMDGHKLFLNSMNSGSPEKNDDGATAKEAKFMLDLFKHNLIEKTHDLSNNPLTCECFQRMVFCGYDVYRQNERKNDDVIDSDSVNDVTGGILGEKNQDKQHLYEKKEVQSYPNDNDITKKKSSTVSLINQIWNTLMKGRQIFNDDTKLNEKNEIEDNKHLQLLQHMIPDNDIKYTLWSASAITVDDLEIIRNDPCEREGMDKKMYKCDTWAGLRSFLFSNIFKQYSQLDQDVIDHRKEVLLSLGAIDKSYENNTKEWTIVGLTQRTYRRSWINLPEVIENCNALHTNVSKVQMKVVCIEINVEKMHSPYEQLLLHHSVDALIGVHGAQLTQAILLPSHGHVLELLPWVPDYIRGNWVQTRHTPTPLGIIFHNTDLNHVGYSLERDSVPLCEGVGDVGSEKNCFLNRTNKKHFIWDYRNFKVRPDIIIQYIERFLMVMQNRHGIYFSCDDIVNRLDKNFVMFNVWCSIDQVTADDETSKVSPKLVLKHYYSKVKGAKRLPKK